MAIALILSKMIATLFTIIFISSLALASSSESNYYKTTSFKKHKTMTHIHLFLHEQTSGDNATEAAVAFGGNNTVNPSVPFGLVAAFDYLLTEKNESSSKQIGKAQGMLVLSSQSENSITIPVNFMFTEGKYNGSTVTVLGQNNLSLKVRELPIIGGTGLFRFARGYIETSTVFSSASYYIFEWDLYIYHY